MLLGCIRGDDAAKAIFYNRYKDLIGKAILLKLAQVGAPPNIRDMVEDIRHDLFVRLWADNCRLLAQLKQPRCIDAWLTTTAQRFTIDCLRRAGTRQRQETASVAEKPAAYQAASFGPEEAERTKSLRAALDHLADEDRLIITLYYVEGLRYADIAAILRMNMNTVAARLRRTKQKLLRLLVEDGHAG
ncbi:MAG: sigma-70 family RNA polymerase sigma factor [Candidatus Hydrogenedentes bacterium]|nr:sigma-70 family RNA polymerase sigma factor [Candidatus Hydrogenedentota bacterium]